MEPYGDNGKTSAYKSFFFVSYINYSDGYIYSVKDCQFKIVKISDSYNEIKIKYDTYCDETIYNYTVFITNNTNDNKGYNCIKLFYEKDINKDIKYYEFQEKGPNTIKISDSFEKGNMIITIVGQDTEGFKRFVYNTTIYNYKGEKKTYLTLIIISIVVGAVLVILIILYVIRYIRKKNMNNDITKDKVTEKLNCKDFENPDFKWG